jgi:hypothetical protein
MDYELFCPQRLFYYINKNIIIRTINNTSEEYVWVYSYPNKKYMLVMPPNTKRRYMFTDTTKKIMLQYDKKCYIVNLSYDNILTIP